MLNNKKIVVVLPAYNAEKTLGITYNEIPFDIVDDVVLVDDASKDKTILVAEEIFAARGVLAAEGFFVFAAEACFATVGTFLPLRDKEEATFAGEFTEAADFSLNDVDSEGFAKVSATN